MDKIKIYFNKQSFAAKVLIIFIFIAVGFVLLPITICFALGFLVYKKVNNPKWKYGLLAFMAFITFFVSKGWVQELTNPSSNTKTTAEDITANKTSQNQAIDTKTNEQIETTLSAKSEDMVYKVVEVVDGDTIKVDYNGIVTSVRFIGIDTPETVDPRTAVQCYGKEASDKTKELLNGKSIKLVKDTSDVDQYSRLLRYVYVGDTFVNEYLVRQGYANAASYQPDIKYQSLFTSAEKEARDNKRGLWGDVCACEKGKETKRECTACNRVTVTKTQWNCSTYTETADDSSCTTQCATNSTPNNTNTNANANATAPEPQNNSNCVIKGNISSSKEKIYHLPGCSSYNSTIIDESAGERWFCTEQEAVGAGWRKAKNCP